MGTHMSTLLFNEYQQDRLYMVFKILCILIFWVKVALALEGLRDSLVVEAMLHHIMTKILGMLIYYVSFLNPRHYI